VEEIRPGTLSLMPEGFDQQFSKEELADLVAFLKSLK
jgi:cytochrome c1